MSNIDFIKTGIKNIKKVGAISRSSRFLCKEAVNHIDFANANVIVEIGAGDGVITKHLLEQMHPDTRLLAFEIMPNLAQQIRQINDDRLVVIEDSAEFLPQYLKNHGIEKTDFVVSAIPFVMFSDEEALSIIRICSSCLKKGGKYIQIHYSLLAKKLYQEVFGNVTGHFVPINIPPAWVLVSEQK